MSQLTSEEREFFDEVRLAAVDDEMIKAIQIIDRLSARLNEYEADRKEARDCTATFWMNYGEKVGSAHLDAEDRVIRLSARCEEVQKERDDYFRIIEERGVQITKLCDNLSALLEAVEQGQDFWMGNGYFYGSTLQAPAGITLTKVKVIIAETLSAVAAGIRGKG